MREKDKISHKYMLNHGLDIFCEGKTWLAKEVSLCSLSQRGNLCLSGWGGCLVGCKAEGRIAGPGP